MCQALAQALPIQQQAVQSLASVREVALSKHLIVNCGGCLGDDSLQTNPPREEMGVREGLAQEVMFELRCGGGNDASVTEKGAGKSIPGCRASLSED